MTKDVIYIDVEDDITTIIGKIKASKERIIALVPPNRVGVLQSAVNMRLLARTADQAGKRIVLISNNQSLAALAAAAKIPAARTLQSKPELAEVPTLKVDGDDVIDGETLAVGDLATSTTDRQKDSAISAAIQASSDDKKPREAKKLAKSKTKVPNFSVFRKKFFIIGACALLLIGFLVWAIGFAPRATVVITAKTTSVTIDDNVTLSLSEDMNAENNIIRATKQEQAQDLSVDFTATGKKDMGEKATGTVRFSTNNIDNLGTTIAAGTEITSSSGAQYSTDSSVTITLNNYRGVNVGVTASAAGTKFNGATGSASGAPSGISVSFVGVTSGGTTREVTVVSEEDVTAATEKLNQQKDDTLKTKLTDSFGSSNVVLKDSYSESRSDPVPSVAVGSEVSGAVKLSTKLTASMLAIEKTNLSTFLDGKIKAEIDGKEAQKIYENGADNVKFAQFATKDDVARVRITANGTVGPTIDEDQVKEQSRGKRYGEIQSSLEAIEGIEDVDTQFWPFWVRTVPNNVDRITVEFKLENA